MKATIFIFALAIYSLLSISSGCGKKEEKSTKQQTTAQELNKLKKLSEELKNIGKNTPSIQGETTSPGNTNSKNSLENQINDAASNPDSSDSGQLDIGLALARKNLIGELISATDISKKMEIAEQILKSFEFQNWNNFGNKNKKTATLAKDLTSFFKIISTVIEQTGTEKATEELNKDTLPVPSDKELVDNLYAIAMVLHIISDEQINVESRDGTQAFSFLDFFKKDFSTEKESSLKTILEENQKKVTLLLNLRFNLATFIALDYFLPLTSNPEDPWYKKLFNFFSDSVIKNKAGFISWPLDLSKINDDDQLRIITNSLSIAIETENILISQESKRKFIQLSWFGADIKKILSMVKFEKAKTQSSSPKEEQVIELLELLQERHSEAN